MTNLVASAIVADVTGRIKPFDLRRQETIERARLRNLQPMLETVAHRIGGTLTGALRQQVHSELVALDQLSWEDYSASLPEQTYVSSAVLLPLEDRVVLHLPVPLLLGAIDYYLGGDGLNPPARRQLTEIERNLVNALVEGIWNEIPQPFATIVPLTPAMVMTATNALLIQMAGPGVLCLISRLQIQIGDHAPEKVELCTPITLVMALIEHLERSQNRGADSGAVSRGEARRRLLGVGVELAVAYPPIGLRPAELLGLRVGDVIPLGSFEPGAPHELELSLGDVAYGTGVLVENGSKLACTILTKKERSDGDR